MPIIRKLQLAMPVIAMTALALAPVASRAVTAGDIAAVQVLNTSPLWADSASYHACNVVNVTTSPVNVWVELIDSGGAVLATSGTTPVALAAGTSMEIDNASFVGFARCRVMLNEAPSTIRANLTIFHLISVGVYSTYATSEAR